MGDAAPPFTSDSLFDLPPALTPASPQLGRVLAVNSMEDFYALFKELTPPLEGRPRAQERRDRDPAIEARHPTVFPESFSPGTMTDAYENWACDFGPTDFATSQVQGVHWRWKPGHEDDFLDATTYEPVVIPGYEGSCSERVKESVRTQIQDLLKDGRILDVTDKKDDPLVVAFSLAVFGVEQGAKIRMVVDARPVNDLITCETFHMETLATAAKLARPGGFSFTLDMWNGFHQLRLRDDMRRFLCFHWEGRTYQWQVMPFGLNVAPRVYQKCMLKLFGKWREQGILCCSYIDDGYWTAQLEGDLEAARETVLSDLARYGLIVNKEKAQIQPGQAVKFLGAVIDSSGEEVALYVPEEKVDSITLEVSSIIREVDRGRSLLPGARLASLIGRVVATRYAFGPARLLTRELLACLRQLPMREMKGKDGLWYPVRDYSGTVRLTWEAEQELRSLLEMKRWNGQLWAEVVPTIVISTDGSSEGVGGIARRVRDGEEAEIVAWTRGEVEMDESSLHSSQTELDALVRTMANLGGNLQGETVLHRTDNIGLFYALSNGGFAVGSNSTLNLGIKKVWLLSVLLGVRLQSEYIGSERIIRSGADLLSRDGFDDRSRLSAEAFKLACDRLNVDPTCDAFAEKGLSQDSLPYFSRRRSDASDQLCLGVDGLSAQWPEGTIYAFPPLPLVDTAVHKALLEVKRRGRRVLLVVPDWPQRSWTALLAAFPSVDLGRFSEVTSLPNGAPRPIDSLRTWAATSLRAVLVQDAA